MTRQKLRSFATDRPVAVTMIMLAIAVFGAVSFTKLRMDLLPEISYPTLTVRTTWPGAAPEDVEERISSRVQEAVNTLPNLVRTRSISRANTSDVVLDFDWGTNIAFAVQDVREKLDGLFLPRGSERPLILRYDPNLDPILRLGLTAQGAAGEATGERDLVHLRWLAEKRLKRELEALEGVAAVLVRGGLQEEIRVRVDPYKLAAHNLSPESIAQRLTQENLNASGGSLKEGSTEYLVRTLNEFQEVGEIGELALARRAGGTIRIRDVADVVRGHRRREVTSRIGGRDAVELEIYREAGVNLVRLADRVKERVFGTEAQQAFTAGLVERGEDQGDLSFEARAQSDYLAWTHRRAAELSVLSDQSGFIRGAIDEVRSSAVTGSLLAVGVLWLFLRQIVPTAIIALAIPLSVIVTFAPMFLMDVTLNVMSLGGLALGVGMLVDNAIVVLESVTRCREEGDDPSTAAVRGTREITGAVIAATLTTVVVFAPMVFVSGIAGQIFGDQALTVVTSVSISMLVALLCIPMLASRRWLHGIAAEPDALEPAAEAEPASAQPNRAVRALRVIGRLPLWLIGLVTGAAGYLVQGGGGRRASALSRVLEFVPNTFLAAWSVLERAYERLLRASLAHPLAVVAVAALLLVESVRRLPHLGVELLPEMHQGEFTAHVRMDVGNPLDVTDAVMRELDRSIAALPDVAQTALVCGVETDTLTREIEGPHTSRLTVRLTPAEDGSGGAAREEAVEERVRTILESHPAVQAVEVRRPTPFALEAPIAVEVRGHDLATLAAVGEQVAERLQRLDDLADVRSSTRPGHPEALITFDRDKTLEYGLDLATVSNLVRDHVLGNVGTRFSEGEDRIDVRVIGDEVLLGHLDDVLELVVNPASPTPVPLRAVATVRTVQGPAEIRRIGNSRAVEVTARSRNVDLGGVTASVQAALATLPVPDDVVVELGGQKREMDEAQASMREALILAIFLVYVVMAVQFESLLQPLIIMFTLPLGAVGVVLALDWFEIPMSVLVFLGLILLAGVVTDNAIVLLDRVNQKRAEGLAAREALLEGGQVRLRPIMMTTLTTVLGLLPMTGWLDAPIRLVAHVIPSAASLLGGQGAEMRAPMAITVIAGLAVSTLLTLVVIPCVYLLLSGRERRART